MKHKFLPVILALTIASPAAADTLTGTINWVNPDGQQTLVDGYHSFTLAPGANTPAVQVGNTVNLTFTALGGEEVVTKVSPAAAKSG